MADTAKGAGASTPASDNLSEDALIGLLAAPEPEPEETEAEETEEETDEVEETEEVESEEEEAEETEDEAPEINIDDLTPEQLQSLGKQARSRAMSEMGQMRQELKQLRDELRQSKEQTADPLADDTPKAENPFAELTTLEALKSKRTELTNLKKDTDRLLDDHEDDHLDEIIYTSTDGREYTKRQIKAANRNAAEAIAEHLPAQAEALQVEAKREEFRASFAAQAAREVPLINQEDSDVGKAFKMWTGSPLIQQVRKQFPQLTEIDWLLAHAANSLYGGKKTAKAPATVTRPAAKVPASPSAAGAAPSRPAGSKEKAAAEALKSFERSGRSADLERALSQL